MNERCVSMIFRIVNFNREYDIYGVISNEGEQRNVTSFQIIKVMLQGYKFDNAYLTKKGFALQTDSGTRYFQVNMDKQTQKHVLQFLNTKKLVEQQIAEQQRHELEAEKKRKEQEAIRQAQLLREEQQRKQAQQQANKKVRTIDTSNGKPTKINSNNRNQKIFYRGNLYYSEEQLSKKFNAEDRKSVV